MAKGYTKAVREHLIEHGRIDVHQALFGGLEGLHPTRIAAIVWSLRHKQGWNIQTIEPPGKLATYILLSRPGHPDDWEKTPEGVADAEGLPEPHDPDDDVPGFHGMPPDEEPYVPPTPEEQAAAKAKRVENAHYDCGKKGCIASVVSVSPTALAPGVVEVRCTKGHKTLQKKVA